MNTDSLPYVKINDTGSEFDTLPFRSCLSFRPLIEFWENESRHNNKLKSAIATTILDGLKSAPELREPIYDFSIIDRYKETVDLLMTVIYAPSQWGSQISTSSVPFQFKSFYSTPEFTRVFGTAEEAKNRDFGLDYEMMYRGKIVNAYLIILKKFYNKDITTDTPVVIRLKDDMSHVYKYYRLNIDAGFTTVNCIGTLPPLTREDINELLKDPYNIESWFKALPPENFEFEGFVTYTAIDVTAQEAVSALKFDLLEKESIISMERFRTLEDKLKSLFELPDLRMGLVSLPEDWSMFMDYARKIGDSFLLNESCKFNCTNFDGSIYEQAEGGKKPIIIEDLATHTPCTEVEKELLKQGLRSLLIAPLYYKNKVIGVLELGSPNPGDINALNWIKIKSVLMLFATAVKRSMEELDTQVQAVIKEECTAIHPSVEWRFRKAAVSLIFKREADMPKWKK